MSENLPTGSTDNPAGLDIVAITRDDEVVEALGLGLPVVAESQADFELAEMLADWRATVHGAPVENLINPEVLRRVLWQPPVPLTAETVDAALAADLARPWQRELVVPLIVRHSIKAP